MGSHFFSTGIGSFLQLRTFGIFERDTFKKLASILQDLKSKSACQARNTS